MKSKIFIFILFFIFYKSFAYGDIIQDSKIWKFFAKIANDAVTNFPEIPVLKSELEQGILKFGSATYVGQIKGGKAHGTGVFIFPDGSKYEGNFKRNMFHGDGIYKDENGNSYDGKWKYNKLHQQINKKTREVIQLSKSLGKSEFYEIRGDGQLKHKWFEAKLSTTNSKEIPPITELDIFDLPSVFSKDYGDEEKIKELLDIKNSLIASQNVEASKKEENIETVFVLTEKGKQDFQIQKEIMSTIATSKPQSHSASSGGMMSGGGGGGGGGC